MAGDQGTYGLTVVRLCFRWKRRSRSTIEVGISVRVPPKAAPRRLHLGYTRAAGGLTGEVRARIESRLTANRSRLPWRDDVIIDWNDARAKWERLVGGDMGPRIRRIGVHASEARRMDDSVIASIVESVEQAIGRVRRYARVQDADMQDVRAQAVLQVWESVLAGRVTVDRLGTYSAGVVDHRVADLYRHARSRRANKRSQIGELDGLGDPHALDPLDAIVRGESLHGLRGIVGGSGNRATALDTDRDRYDLLLLRCCLERPESSARRHGRLLKRFFRRFYPGSSLGTANETRACHRMPQIRARLRGVVPAEWAET